MSKFVMGMIRKFFSHNWFAIFYFNFKMLPFKQAIKLPFDFYYKVRFENLRGKVTITTPDIKRGMIKFGSQGSDMFARTAYIISLRGKLVFDGACALGTGGSLKIEKDAVVRLEENVILGAFNIILSETSIIVKKNTISSWKCQFMDTDTHSIYDLDTQEIGVRKKEIVIGKRNWIGNNVIFNKGTITPDDTVVASSSLCNKNYSLFVKPYSILGGIPAKQIATNKKCCFDKL